MYLNHTNSHPKETQQKTEKGILMSSHTIR